MASLRQIESARRNGAKSKGPITDEGKARSSRNATKHGFAAGHHVLVINEREDLYQLMLAEYMQNFQPANRVEADLVSRMVAAQWKMQRIDTAEAAMLDLQMDRDRPGIENEFNHIDEGTRLGIAFDGLANSGNGLALAGRYFSRAERTYTRALQNLRLLQRDRLRSEGARPSEPAQHSPAGDNEKGTNEPNSPPPTTPSPEPAVAHARAPRFARKTIENGTNEPEKLRGMTASRNVSAAALAHSEPTTNPHPCMPHVHPIDEGVKYLIA